MGEIKNQRERRIWFTLKKYMEVAFIDSEGIIETCGGSRSNKLTTLWIKKVGLIIYCLKTRKITLEKEWIIQMPKKFKELSNAAKFQWRFTYKTHRCHWDAKGVRPFDFFWELSGLLSNITKIYAKGKYMEERLLNRIGIFGEVIYKDQYNKAKMEVKLIDLNIFGIPKYDYLLFQRAQKQHKQGINKEWCEMIMQNYKYNMALYHSPCDECKAFCKAMFE